MTATPHPLAESRRLLLLEAATLDRCRAAYHKPGEWYLAASLTRAMEYLGECVRILDKLIEATSREDEQ